MKVRMMYQFPGTFSNKRRETVVTWSWQDKATDLLAVAYTSDFVKYPPGATLSFFLLHAATGNIVQMLSSTFRATSFDELRLAFDPLTQGWMLADIEFQATSHDPYAVIRQVQREPDEQGNVFVPLFEDVANDMAAHGPLLDFHCHDHACTFLLLKSAQADWFTPQILRGWIDLSNGQQGVTVLLETESALLCRQDQASLLVVLQSRMNMQTQQEYWGLLTTVYDAHYQEVYGHETPELRLPTRLARILNQPAGNDFEWLAIHAAAIAGPPSPRDGSQTWVVGMTMKDIFELKGREHTSVDASLLPVPEVNALWALGASGALQQQCQNAPGLCIQLCRVETMIIGVDLQAGRWRLWNWEPLREQAWRAMLTLELEVKRAHVVAAPEHEPKSAHRDTFWLLEERQSGVRISQRDVFTLEEVSDAVTVERVRLPEQQRRRGSLDWYTEINASVYQGLLYFLGVDDASHLALYEVG